MSNTRELPPLHPSFNVCQGILSGQAEALQAYRKAGEGFFIKECSDGMRGDRFKLKGDLA